MTSGDTANVTFDEKCGGVMELVMNALADANARCISEVTPATAPAAKSAAREIGIYT